MKEVCSIKNCNCKAFQRIDGIPYCAKHHSQMKTHGKILKRTIYDKNDIITNGEVSYMILYDKNCNEVARTMIDTKNINLIHAAKWYLRKDGYVASTNYQGKYTYLHRLICKKLNKKFVDHKDRNKLNNTESNLRTATCSENQMNKGIRSNNKSGKVGVHQKSSNGKWVAMICVNKKHKNLGTFDTFEEAVKTRIEAEKKYFGQYRVENELEV